MILKVRIKVEKEGKREVELVGGVIATTGKVCSTGHLVKGEFGHKRHVF